MSASKEATPQTPSSQETVFVSRKSQRDVASFITLPVATAAALVGPSYLLIQQRTASVAAVPGTGTAGLLSLFRSAFSILPTVFAKQTGRSVSGATTTRMLEAGVESDAALEKQAATTWMTPTFAVGFETGFSGLIGLMQAQAKGKITKPTEITSSLRAATWHAYATTKFTPHTASWTAAAAASSVFGLTVISPLAEEQAKGWTASQALQKLYAVAATSSLVSLVTTPINTIGGRYLAAVGIEQAGKELKLKATKSLYETTQELFKAGSKEALRSLYRPYPVTVGMTFIAYGTIKVVNAAVDIALPDYTVTVTQPSSPPPSSCTFAPTVTEKTGTTQSPGAAPAEAPAR